jgi:hypothetical protein
LPERAKVPLLFESGEPNESVPVNRLPLLQRAVTVVTNEPNGALLIIVGLGGLKLNVRYGVGAADVNSTSTK